VPTGYRVNLTQPVTVQHSLVYESGSQLRLGREPPPSFLRQSSGSRFGTPVGVIVTIKRNLRQVTSAIIWGAFSTSHSTLWEVVSGLEAFEWKIACEGISPSRFVRRLILAVLAGGSIYRNLQVQ
jgi:hypothetical protein